MPFKTEWHMPYAVYVASASGATITDVDDTQINSATVSITGGLMTSEDVLAFVEVKSRSAEVEESGAYAVGPLKQSRIARAAEHYLLTHEDVQGDTCRFDVVLVEMAGVRRPRARKLIRDAFRLG